MSERYWLTGAQLGMLIAADAADKHECIGNVLDEIGDKQFIGRIEEGQDIGFIVSHPKTQKPKAIILDNNALSLTAYLEDHPEMVEKFDELAAVLQDVGITARPTSMSAAEFLRWERAEHGSDGHLHFWEYMADSSVATASKCRLCGKIRTRAKEVKKP